MKRFSQDPIGVMWHHSFTKDGLISNNTFAIDRYHEGTNGWDDIGYHFLIEFVDNRPVIMSGRPLIFQGAHCPEVNATHLGVCIIGNFDEERISNELFQAAVRCGRGIMQFYPHIKVSDHTFHNKYSSKTCPGTKFPETAFLLALSE